MFTWCSQSYQLRSFPSLLWQSFSLRVEKGACHTLWQEVVVWLDVASGRWEHQCILSSYGKFLQQIKGSLFSWCVIQESRMHLQGNNSKRVDIHTWFGRFTQQGNTCLISLTKFRITFSLITVTPWFLLTYTIICYAAYATYKNKSCSEYYDKCVRFQTIAVNSGSFHRNK